MVRLEPGPGRTPRFPSAIEGAHVERIESAVLAGNPLGDPSVRGVAVYRPPSGRTEGVPLVLLLGGFSSGATDQSARPRFLGESELGLFDRLVRAGAMPEAVLVSPDCLTSLGGSQYVNSSATGRYADFVLDELLPWAKETFRSGPCGVVGQSSGGFGALHLAMERPGAFDAVGTSAADLDFELTIAPDIPKAVRTYRQFGGPEAFLGRLAREPSLLRSETSPVGAALLMLALGACYSPRAGAGAEFDLPFDLETGERVEDVWKRWLSFDPLVRLDEEAVQAALRRLRLLYLTASSEDEWFLDLAARRYAQRLGRVGLRARYEEFPGGHFDKRPRYEALFPALVRALSASAP